MRFHFGDYEEIWFWYMTPYSLPEFSDLSIKLTVLLNMQSEFQKLLRISTRLYATISHNRAIFK